jgi:hypothetical protein
MLGSAVQARLGSAASSYWRLAHMATISGINELRAIDDIESLGLGEK